MKVKKRTKNSRIRGARTCGWGFRQSHKGHGSKGGFGMAGSGKRGDHKKQKAGESDKSNRKQYFGKQGVTSRRTAKKKYDKINLADIKANFSGLTHKSVPSKKGTGVPDSSGKIDLKNYKILGNGEGFKAEITAKAATQSAIEKMEKAGGKIILPVKKEIKKIEKVEAEVEKATE